MPLHHIHISINKKVKFRKGIYFKAQWPCLHHFKWGPLHGVCEFCSDHQKKGFLNEILLDLKHSLKNIHMNMCLPLNLLYEIISLESPNNWGRRCGSCGDTLVSPCLSKNLATRMKKKTENQNANFEIIYINLYVIFKLFSHIIVILSIDFTTELFCQNLPRTYGGYGIDTKAPFLYFLVWWYIAQPKNIVSSLPTCQWNHYFKYY